MNVAPIDLTKVGDKEFKAVESGRHFVVRRGNRKAALVSIAFLTRLQRLEYRRKLENAERCNDERFLNGEIKKHRLTRSDLDRLVQQCPPSSKYFSESIDSFRPQTKTKK